MQEEALFDRSGTVPQTPTQNWFQSPTTCDPNQKTMPLIGFYSCVNTFDNVLKNEAFLERVLKLLLVNATTKGA